VEELNYIRFDLRYEIDTEYLIDCSIDCSIDCLIDDYIPTRFESISDALNWLNVY